jgi:hypothetical protein
MSSTLEKPDFREFSPGSPAAGTLYYLEMRIVLFKFGIAKYLDEVKNPRKPEDFNSGFEAFLFLRFLNEESRFLFMK